MNRGKRANNASIGVILFQLGGPDSLEAVEPFLYNLFSDPDIIDFPLSRLARPTLARIIASRRARKARQHYAEIGGRSPIRELTELQAKALERELRSNLDARVFVAMRYWHPLTEEAVQQVGGHSFQELVLLPLYPQFSRTTTGSSLREWGRKYEQASGRNVPVKVVHDFHSHPGYVDAIVEKISEGMQLFGASGSESVHLLFSAHGVPLSVIKAGDPYQSQVEATVKLVTERGGWSNPYRICYQSRVGPGQWLGPSLEEAIHTLAGEGAQNVLVVPVSFVSDHVETLNEINIGARRLAERSGIRQFELMPALNDSPKFIQALADLVLGQVSPPGA